MPLMNAKRSRLAIIDFQARLMPAIHDGPRLVANAGRLVAAAKLLEVPIVMTEQNPAGLFFMPSDPQPANAVDRAHPRYPLLVTIKLRRMEDACEGSPEELTITEDVSLGGAGVRTTLPVARGELVSLAELDGPFRASALVQNVSQGADKIVRLNLQFMNEAEAASAVRELLRRHGITTETGRS